MNTQTEKNIPLTREEMAVYMNYMDDNFKKCMIDLNTKIAGQNELIVKLVEKFIQLNNQNTDKITKALTQNSLGSSTTDLHYISDSVNSLCQAVSELKINNKHTVSIAENNINFNTMDINDIQKWISNIWKSCEIIGKYTNETKIQVLKKMYSHMRTKGVNLSSLYKEYRATSPVKLAQINMCAKSDYLRKVAEDCIKEMYSDVKSPNEVEESKVTVHKALYKNSNVVDEICRKYAKNNSISEQSAKIILAMRLKKISGVNIKEERAKFASKHGVKTCSFGTYVENNPELFKMLKKISKEKKNG